MSKTADDFEVLTEQDLEQLRQLYHGGHVTAADCEQFRTWAAAGERPEAIADRESVAVAVQTVRYHVNGHCDHDIPHPPVRRVPPAVSPRDCEQFRIWAANGFETQDIAARETVPYATETVGRHLRGDCSHEEDTVGHPSLTWNEETMEWEVDD